MLDVQSSFTQILQGVELGYTASNVINRKYGKYIFNITRLESEFYYNYVDLSRTFFSFALFL